MFEILFVNLEKWDIIYQGKTTCLPKAIYKGLFRLGVIFRAYHKVFKHALFLEMSFHSKKKQEKMGSRSEKKDLTYQGNF